MSHSGLFSACHAADASSIIDFPAGKDFQRIGPLLARTFPDAVVSKRRMRKVESIECVRLKRETARQNLGFSSRPFVLCGLPVRRPSAGSLLHERRNGHFVLQVTGHPSYGLPRGQDRLVPIFLATQAVRQKSPQITFETAAAMLDTFGMQQGGSQYRRLFASFQRIFGATIFFGTGRQRERATVIHRARFNFMTEARIWYFRDPDQQLLPGDCQNMARPCLSRQVSMYLAKRLKEMPLNGAADVVAATKTKLAVRDMPNIDEGENLLLLSDRSSSPLPPVRDSEDTE